MVLMLTPAEELPGVGESLLSKSLTGWKDARSVPGPWACLQGSWQEASLPMLQGDKECGHGRGAIKLYEKYSGSWYDQGKAAEMGAMTVVVVRDVGADGRWMGRCIAQLPLIW